MSQFNAFQNSSHVNIQICFSLDLIDHFYNKVSSFLKYSQEHHLPGYYVDLNLKSMHYTKQHMK